MNILCFQNTKNAVFSASFLKPKKNIKLAMRINKLLLVSRAHRLYIVYFRLYRKIAARSETKTKTLLD